MPGLLRRLQPIPEPAAAEAATGQQRWRAETGVVRRSSAAVADGVVYVVGDVLLAVDAMAGTSTGG